MYRPAVLFIGLRYIYGRTTDRFSSFISWLSTIGISFGVMSLIVVLSVMNGFERELQNNVLRLIPHVILSSVNGCINPQQLPKHSIKLQGVVHITPLTTSDVILQSNDSIAIGTILGIDPSKYDPLISYLVNVRLDDLLPGKYNVILGAQLAYKLGVNYGDQLRVIVPSVNQYTPMGRLPIQRIFNVIGIFYTKCEIDDYQILVNIQDASCLMHYLKNNITGWRLWLKDPLKVNEINQQQLSKNIKWYDWRERKGELFQAVRIEKNMMGLLLSLIIIVAMFNIVSSLSLIIMDKRSEIAILQMQGLTPNQIMIIFIIYGANIGINGALLGVLFGIIFASQLNNIILITSLLYNNIILPVKIEFFQISYIVFIVIIITLLCTLYPSWRATTIDFTKTLRYE